MIFKKNKKYSSEIPSFKMGVKKDEFDEHDYNFRAIMEEIELPSSVDLRPYLPSVFSQNQQGSCTANVGVGAIEYLYNVQQNKKLILSRQFLYNQERINDGVELTEDNGSSMRQICKTLKKNGCCEEDLFTYGNGNEIKIPPNEAYINADNYKITDYYRCDNLYEAKVALYKKLPVLLGIDVYDEFYYPDKKGFIPKINLNNQSRGGHAILLVGYFTVKTLCGIKTYYIIRNSWGQSIKNEKSWGYAFNNPSDSGFGDNGYAYIEENNLKSIILDMWATTGVESID